MADDQLLEPGANTPELESGEDLAAKALTASNLTSLPGSSGEDDELQESNQLAETLGMLQNVIERNANELERLKNELKEKQESLRSVYENDTTLAEAEEQAKTFSQEVKQRKSTLKSSPQVTSLNTQIGELKEQKKEIEETLNSHLINYYSLTNSTSFDTSDGDQWDFNLRANLKTRKAPKGE